MKVLVSVHDKKIFLQLLYKVSASLKQILSLILCWGLYASAETELREEAANTDELPAALEDVLDDGPEEQLASREGR